MDAVSLRHDGVVVVLAPGLVSELRLGRQLGSLPDLAVSALLLVLSSVDERSVWLRVADLVLLVITGMDFGALRALELELLSDDVRGWCVPVKDTGRGEAFPTLPLGDVFGLLPFTPDTAFFYNQPQRARVCLKLHRIPHITAILKTCYNTFKCDLMEMCT